MSCLYQGSKRGFDTNLSLNAEMSRSNGSRTMKNLKYELSLGGREEEERRGEEE